MAENQALLKQLQRQNARIQGLLTPALKQTAGSEPFAGRKFQVAARKMRVLTADGPGFTTHRQIKNLSSEVVHRFQNAETGLHINPNILQAKNKTWDGVERVFHGSGTVQAKREAAPAMPGEMRQGSIIPRMETFPKPGQPIEAFRQQIESAPRPSRTPEPAKKTVIAPKSRLFTKVEEISRQPAKAAPPAAADEPDPPALSLRSPPPAAPEAPVQRKIEQAVEPPSAAPMIQRVVDVPDSPMPAVMAKNEPVSFEAGKSADVPPASSTPVLPNLPVTVARKAETLLPPAPKASAPAVTLPAKQVARSPLQDQPVKPPAAKALQRKADTTGEAPAQQSASSQPAFAQPVAPTPSVSLPAPTIQRAAIETEPDAVEMPGNLPAENKEPLSDEPMVQAKLIQRKPVTPAPDRVVVPVSSPTPSVESKAPIVQAKPAQRQLSRPLQAKLIQAKPAEALKPILPTSQTGAVSTTATPVQGSGPSVTAPVELVQRASFKDADHAENATSPVNMPQRENSVVEPKEIPSQISRPSPGAPILQAKPLQANVVQPKPLELARPILPVSSKTDTLLPASPVQAGVPSESSTSHLVQREAIEPVEEEISRKPMLAQAKLIQREASEPVEEEISRKPMLAQPKIVQREAMEPDEEEVSRKPMLAQAKLVQREAIEPDEEEVSRKPMLVQAKQVSRPMPLATQNRILPAAQNAVQRVVASTQAPAESAFVQRAENRDLPISSGFPSIARLVDKPEGFSSSNSLIRRMPLVEKIHSRPQVKSILRSADSEPSFTKNNQPALVQLQPSRLIQTEKYQSVAMPAVLPDMALPGKSASISAISTGAAPMMLARKADAGTVPAASFAAPMQQPVVSSVASEKVFSGMVQRAVDNSLSPTEPSLAAVATEQTQPGNLNKDNAKPADLNALAEDIFPLVKRLLAIEADRSGGGFR